MIEGLRLTPVPQTLSATSLRDRYPIERELDGGPAMRVLVARDAKGGGRVAVKVLRREVAAGGGAERFLAQVPLVASLQHPNILPIVDSGTARGPSGEDVVYCVSPYVEGGNLRQRLERDPQLPLDEALRIVGGVASALEAAHRHGLAHRYIKPENILLRNGEPLVDFGVGRLLAGVIPDWERDATGPADGASYASPEQLETGRGDVQSDQYSLAVVLYEMLTGQPPFSGATAAAVKMRVLTQPPPRLTAVRVVPRVIERAVNRALAKSPAERFRTVGEFVAALHGASVTPALPAVPTSPPRAGRRPWRFALIASAVVSIIAAGVAMGSRAVVTRRAVTASAHRQLTFAGTATAPMLAPDGRAVAYVAGGRSLVVQRLDGGDALEIVRSVHGISAARWTGDGRWLVVAMTRDSTEGPATYLVSAGGGPARKVLEDVRPFDAGPDSTILVRVGGEVGTLEVVNLVSGMPTRTIALPDSVTAVGEMDWSPDQRWVAVTEASTGRLWVVAALGSSANPVADGARAVRWAAGSGALYFLSGRAGAVELMRVDVDPQSGARAGSAARVTSLLAADAFDVALDRLVHTQASRDAHARVFVLGGSPPRVVEERPLSEGGARVTGPSVSPDGQRIAYGVARGAARDIHVVTFDGGSPRAVAESPAREEAPAWSPDGTRLTFAREDSAGRRLVMADVRTGVAQRLGPLPGPGVAGDDTPGPRAAAAGARWSASGRHIAYFAQDLRRIGYVNLQRRTQSVITLPDSVGAGHFFVVPSPNGTQLLASTIRPGDERATLWLVFGNGRRWRRIAGPFGETVPIAWQRSGWIYLVRNRALSTDHGSVHVELWRMRGPTGRPELYAQLPEGCGISVSISGDATRGVCDYVRVESDVYVASNFGGTGGLRRGR